MKVLLFTYGRLQPDYNPPESMSKSEYDSVYADLYDNKRDPLIVNLNGPQSSTVKGHTLTIDDYEFKTLDPIEKGYKRIMTTTNSGKNAYIYVWDGPLPADAKRIFKWPVQ